MSTLTVIILVLLVTTVAEAVPLTESDGWQRTTWSRWDASPNISVGGQAVLLADRTWYDMAMPTEDRLATAYVASWMPQQ
jgi:hypothetical protein